MSYFNFNYTPDPPNDGLVDPAQQIVNNWIEIEDKTAPFTHQPFDLFGTPTVGTEAFDPSNDPTRIAVWTGSIWARSLNHQTAWTDWQALTLRSPFVARPGFPPVARVDAVARRVVLSGGVQINSTGDNWDSTTTSEVTDNAAIQSSLTPVNGGVSRQIATVGAVTAANGFATALVSIQFVTPPDRVAINIRWLGDPAPGQNWVMLDGIDWWY